MALTTDPATGMAGTTGTGMAGRTGMGDRGERIVAMFETLERARTARDALRTDGIPDHDIHILNRDAVAEDSTLEYERNDQGFWGALKSLFVPEPEAPTYTEGLRRGHAMLAVDPPAGRSEQIIRLLEGFDPVDLEQNAREWRTQGWTGAGLAGHGELGRSGTDRPAVEPGMAGPTMGQTAAGAAVGPGATAGVGMRRAETDTPIAAGTEGGAIPVVEEDLAVGKREVDRGRVRVRSYVTERPVEENVTLREERVNVERRPVDRPVGAGDDAFREREIEVSARGEEPVIRKDARVVEEVVVNKEADTRTETVRDNLRRTDVKVEDDRTGNATTPAAKPKRR